MKFIFPRNFNFKNKFLEIDQAHFSVVDSSTDLPFSIEKHSGKIIVRQALDREKKAEWRFVVRADGPMETFATSMVTVRVSDVDDNVSFSSKISKNAI